MTALTLYQSNDNNVTGALVAKRVYATSNAGSFTSHTTGINSTTATGFGELTSHGNNPSAWPALAALGAASGHGLLLDDTSLESQQIIGGNWSTIVRCNSSVGSIIGDFYVRYFVWNSVILTFTSIGQGVLATQTLTTTTTNYLVTASNLPFAPFHANDKLYIDVWLKIITNSQASSVGTISWSGFSSTAGGGSATVNTATPGYQLSPLAIFTGHGTMSASGQAQAKGTLVGHGPLTGSGQAQGQSVSIGHGTFIARGQSQGNATLAGHSTISASGRAQGLASLIGHGTMTARSQAQGNATLAGHGTFLGSGQAQGKATLAGHSAFLANAQAIGAGNLIGHGSLSATYAPPPPLRFGPGILTTKMAAGAITNSQNAASGITTSHNSASNLIVAQNLSSAILSSNNGASGIGGTSRT